MHPQSEQVRIEARGGLGAAVDAAAGQGPKAGSAAAASKAAASFFAFFFCFLKEVCCARVGSGMALGGVLSTSRFDPRLSCIS